MKLVQQAILTHSKFSKSRFARERDFENFGSFFSNTMSSENNDCLYAKFASALATPMWHFMKIAMEEVRRNLFGF